MKKRTAYIILGKTKDNKIVGRTEHSFSMGFSEERVRVERSHNYSYNAKKENKTVKQAAYDSLSLTCNRLRKQFPNMEFKVFRVGSKNCPVRIDWREMVQMSKDRKFPKFNWRNLPFTVKENINF